MQALLTVEDKLSMASSIELRLPYLDNNLVDFVQKVPIKFKLGNLKNLILRLTKIQLVLKMKFFINKIKVAS